MDSCPKMDAGAKYMARNVVENCVLVFVCLKSLKIVLVVCLQSTFFHWPFVGSSTELGWASH